MTKLALERDAYARRAFRSLRRYFKGRGAPFRSCRSLAGAPAGFIYLCRNGILRGAGQLSRGAVPAPRRPPSSRGAGLLFLAHFSTVLFDIVAIYT
jgi:hypothetical protein